MKPGEAEAAADNGGAKNEEQALLEEMGLLGSEKGSTIGLSWTPGAILATLACGVLCTAAYTRQQAQAVFDTRVRRPAIGERKNATDHAQTPFSYDVLFFDLAPELQGARMKGRGVCLTSPQSSKQTDTLSSLMSSPGLLLTAGSWRGPLTRALCPRGGQLPSDHGNDSNGPA